MPQYDLAFDTSAARGSRARYIEPGATGAPTIGYETVETWNVGSSGSPNNAEYWNGGGLPDNHNYAASFFTSTTPVGGGSFTAAPSPTNATYRVRFVGGTLDGTSIEGQIESFRQPDSGVRRAWRIGPGPAFRATMGATSVASGGGTMILERQTTVPGSAENLTRLVKRGTVQPNSAPATDTTRWSPISAWSASEPFNEHVNAIHNSKLFQALNNIAAPNVNPHNADPVNAGSAVWALIAATNWNENDAYAQDAYVFRNTALYKARNSISAYTPPPPNPAPPNASWTQVPAWSGTGAVSQNAYRVYNNNLYQAQSAISAPMDSWNRSSTDDISLGSGTWLGGAATSTRLYFLVRTSNPSQNIARAYDYSGSRMSADDIYFTGTGFSGGFATATRLYFVDANSSSARAYDHSGNRQASDDINLGVGTWLGGAATSTRLYFINSVTNFARAWDHNGNRQAADDINLGTGGWAGSLATATRLYFVDNVTNFARAWDHNGNRQAADDIDLGTGNWFGCVGTTNRLYFLDDTTDYARAYNFVAGTPNSNPSVDTANWTQITANAWSGTSAYNQNDVVSQNSVYYQANAAIPAPSATTYTEVARYNDSATNGKRVSGGAAYHSIPEVCVNHTAASGTFPSTTTGTWRLRYEPSGSATQAAASITGNLTVLFPGNTANPYRCIRVGNSGDYVSTFGVGSSNATNNSPARFFGGTWHLERVTTSPSTPNSPPENDATNWELITANQWSGTRAYAVDDVVQYLTAYYEAQAVVSAPTTSASAQATWNSAVLNVPDNARYIVNFGGNQNYIDAHQNALTGSFPSNLTGTWRLHQVGGGTITGALTLINTTNNNVRFRVGNAAQMQAAFGTVNINTGGQWVLEKTANAAPADDDANWIENGAMHFNGRARYRIGNVVMDGTPAMYFSALQNIEIPTSWRLVNYNDLQSGDIILWQYDNDATAGSRLTLRTVA